MQVLDRVCPTPEENLALDEALLEGEGEALRFWESPAPCVVLGRSSRAGQEAHLEACAAAGIAVLRRCSGGGTVLLGPGCLNFALVLTLANRPDLTGVMESYRILQGALAKELGIPGLEVRGGDILLEDRKVSGSAQRRTRGRLLHHGTLLYDLDIGMVARFLKEPIRQPPHRGGRAHADFLTLLPLRREDVAHALVRAVSRLFSARLGGGTVSP